MCSYGGHCGNPLRCSYAIDDVKVISYNDTGHPDDSHSHAFDDNLDDDDDDDGDNGDDDHFLSE